MTFKQRVLRRHHALTVGLTASFCLTLLLGMSGCSLTPNMERDDPLVGKIIDSRSGQPISFEALLDQTTQADVIYLGEKHDNAEHHAQQLKLLQTLIRRGVKPALGFEFFDVGQTSYLMQYIDASPAMMQLGQGSANTDPETRLRRQLGWQERSDRYWGYYFQLIELAAEQGLEVFGADLSRGITLRISRAGVASLNGVERGLLSASDFDDNAYRASMYKAFRAGHCGWGEEPYLTRLYQTWLARNERMAQSILQMHEASPERPVVLIVGNGHVEHNRGIVERVASFAPDIRQLNLGMREITIEPQPLSAYLETEEGGGLPHDLIWFTQRQDYSDPCAAFKTP